MAAPPLEDNARSYLNTALQIIGLGRPRLQLSLGAVAAKDLENSIMNAIECLEEEAAARREILKAVNRTPDPAAKADALLADMTNTLALMERTNRELAAVKAGEVDLDAIEEGRS